MTKETLEALTKQAHANAPAAVEMSKVAVLADIALSLRSIVEHLTKAKERKVISATSRKPRTPRGSDGR